jgi:hypothetical protein
LAWRKYSTGLSHNTKAPIDLSSKERKSFVSLIVNQVPQLSGEPS